MAARRRERLRATYYRIYYRAAGAGRQEAATHGWDLLPTPPGLTASHYEPFPLPLNTALYTFSACCHLRMPRDASKTTRSAAPFISLLPI